MMTREQAIQAKLIDEEYHDQLLADIDSVARQAGIPIDYVWQPLSKYLSEKEQGYVAKIRDPENDRLGLVYVGKFEEPTINERMMATAGACLRNYINAKVMTLQDVLQSLKTDTMPSPTVLLIPNFCMGKKSGGHLADWEKSNLLGLLYRRQQRSQQTFIYVSSMADMEADLGQPFVEHIRSTFARIKP